MSSILNIGKIDGLKRKIANTIGKNRKDFGIYVSLNKTAKNASEELAGLGAPLEKVFFIDCVSAEKIGEDVLHINPKDLENLSYSIITYLHLIPGEKWVLIDSLSTLLIYNNDNRVAQFMKEITEFSSEKGVHVIAFTPRTGEEELLNKIYGFFDKVEGK